MFRLQIRLLLAIIGMLLAACNVVTAGSTTAQPPSDETVVATNTDAGGSEQPEIADTPTNGPTLTPSITPTRTPKPTSTPILPTPVLPDWVLDDFLFGYAPPGCELPCWQGLRVDESTGDDVQNVFDTVFSFNGMKDFAMRYPDTGDSLKTESSYARSHQWIFGEGPLQQFTIRAWLDKETNVLKALNFRWDFTPENTQIEMSAQRMIQELGPPDHFLVRVGLTERADQGNLTMSMIYSFGLKYGADLHIPILAQGDNYVAEFCLDNSRKNWTGGSILIMEPFADDFDEWTPIQVELLGDPYERMLPIEDVFGMTIEAISEKVLSGEQTCFYSKPLLDQ